MNTPYTVECAECGQDFDSEIEGHYIYGHYFCCQECLSEYRYGMSMDYDYIW